MESYAKAKYLTKWYLSSNIEIEEIAAHIGDQNQTVRNLISGMLVLQQAEDKELFKINDRTKPGPFGFSHLYTALGRIEYRKFLGLERDWNQKPDKHPVSENREKNLEEILVYIYGSKIRDQTSQIGSQNPDIKRLGEVLSMPLALQVLRTTGSLHTAHEECQPKHQLFNDKLVIANQSIDSAYKALAHYDIESGTPLIPIAEEMKNKIEIILDRMSKQKEQ